MFDWGETGRRNLKLVLRSLNLDRSVAGTHYSEADLTANMIDHTGFTGTSLLCVRIVGGRYSELIGKIHMHGSTRGQLRDRARLDEIVDARVSSLFFSSQSVHQSPIQVFGGITSGPSQANRMYKRANDDETFWSRVKPDHEAVT
jgi:hypothetical protein